MSNLINTYLTHPIEGYAADAFVIEWETTTADEVVTIPIRTTADYNVDIDWGDGSGVQTISGVNQDWSHTISVAGTYTFVITPNVTGGWKGFYSTGTTSGLKDIIQWGNSPITNFRFQGTNGIGTITATDEPNWTSLTSMQNAFRDSTMNIPNQNDWEPTGIVIYNSAFRNHDVTGYTFVNWVTSSTTDIGLMFLNGTGLSADLSSWIMQNISDASLFAQNNSQWDITNFSNTLIAWAAQDPDLPSGLVFGIINANYNSSAASAKTTLQSSPHLWTWTDDGEL